MPSAIDPAEFEAVWGLREVTMIRMPTSTWASDIEQAQLNLIATTLPEEWALKMDRVARCSAGFRNWLARLSEGDWRPSEDVSVTNPRELAAVDFRLPWCARLRWGGGVSHTVDVFLHATGGHGELEWDYLRTRYLTTEGQG